MNLRINSLVKSILQKESIQECSVVELQKMADAYPYFEVPQLLLTKKLALIQSVQYQPQLDRTFLYFQNPLWLQHLLNDEGNPVTITQSDIQVPVTPEISIPAAEVNTQGVEISGGLVQDHLVELAPAEEQIKELQAEETAEIIEVEEIVIQGPGNEIFKPEQLEEINSEERAEIERETEREREREPETETPLPPLPTFQEPITDDPKKELILEPYYTVDYFASQGIKYQADEKPKDKFSQQLRSFTDWLRTMKRLPQAAIEEKIAEVPTAGVEQLAQHSLDDREVLTETMAEVWLKQGNTEKAIETYNKLSLLEPSKSHYFAAKIEELKKST